MTTTALPSSKVEPTASLSLFDVALPPEAVEHILRFLSHRPNCVHSECYIQPADVLTLLDASGQLRHAVCEEVRSVSTFEGERWNEATTDRDSKPRGLLVDDERALTALVGALGATLRQLAVDVKGMGEAWIDAWVREARPVAALELHGVDDAFPLDEVLAPCHNLRRLTLKFRGLLAAQQMQCVAKRAGGIRAFELHFVDSAGGFGGVWAQLPYLEDLSIYVWRRMAAKVQMHKIYAGIAHSQSKVRHLTLWVVGSSSNLHHAADLCEAIGARLQSLTLNLPAQESVLTELGRIRAACPVVGVCLLGCNPCIMLRAMQALRDALLELHLHPHFAMRAPINWRAHAVACTELCSVSVVLKLDDFREENCLEPLLSHFGHRLRELCLTAVQSVTFALGSKVPAYIAHVASHTGGLERLALHEVKPLSSLRAIAVANPRLRYLTITIHKATRRLYMDNPDVADRWLVGLVSDFLSNCPRLVDVVVDNPPLRVNEMAPIPHAARIGGLDALCASLDARRKVGVRVGNFFYDRGAVSLREVGEYGSGTAILIETYV